MPGRYSLVKAHPPNPAPTFVEQNSWADFPQGQGRLCVLFSMAATMHGLQQVFSEYLLEK